jgi:hypothetical protein
VLPSIQRLLLDAAARIAVAIGGDDARFRAATQPFGAAGANKAP